MNHIILIGLMGAGKSAVGHSLAARLRREFVDSDEQIEKRAGHCIAEIFATQGEEAFRQMESAFLQALPPAPPRVLSTGGGIVLRRENRQRLRALGWVVWLRAAPKTLWKRIQQSEGHAQRPLLHEPDPLTTLKRLSSQREAFYRQCAHAVVDTDFLPTAQVVRQIEELYLRSQIDEATQWQ